MFKRPLAVMALACLPAAAQADVVVELFTSQGCSSCPPADKVLGDLAQQDGVIPLSFHVDYWDYLGWRDTFADPAHTARQVAYRDRWAERVIYTPQAVVQGREAVRASSARRLASAIAAAPEHDEAIRIVEDAGMLKAQLNPVAGAPPCTVWIAVFDRTKTVEIERGENRGRSITYHNVVRQLSRVGEWQGGAPETVMLPQPGAGQGVAVWLQDGPGGPILAAASTPAP